MARGNSGARRGQGVPNLLIVLALVAALAGLVIYAATSSNTTTSAPATPATSPAKPPLGPLGDLARRTPGDPLAVGRADAPVTMVIFSDYRCPFCAKFSRDTEPTLRAKYVDTGKLRMEWRDFPIFGDQSVQAASAARAAGRQGKFWEFNRALYAAAPDKGHPDLPPDRLLAFAREAGVPDLERFQQDTKSPALLQEVQNDLNEGSSLGVTSTPAFSVNGHPMLGAQPVELFEQRIEQSLAGLS
ncbi:DsbA family protein [Amycolatopsis sp. NPDC058340]|uniref:DsbA family protein n=1 Tax=Amycolatopsis sp. NPDC058340 TaxID=3346453 RepID=UPI003656C5DB